MTMRQFHTQWSPEKLNAAATSAGTDITSSAIRMTDDNSYICDRVVFFGTLTTFNAGNSVKVQSSPDDSTWTDVTGASTNTTADGNAYLIEMDNVGHEYYRVVITRSGANTATGEIWAVKGGARDRPVSLSATDLLTVSYPGS